jgi:hypothetical protein
VDNPLNIVPQSRIWQQTGEWGKLETRIRKLIEKQKDYVFEMEVELKYGRDPTHPRWLMVTVTNTLTNKQPIYKMEMENMPSDADDAYQDRFIDNQDRIIKKKARKNTTSLAPLDAPTSAPTSVPI